MGRLLWLLIFIVFIGLPAYADTPTSATTEGTANITSYTIDKGIEVFAVDWLSNATGDVTATISGVRGCIQRVVYKPDTGAASPTNLYDITLTDVDGVDVLIGTGANLSGTTATTKSLMVTDGNGYWPVCVAGDLTFTLDNAGNANGGIVRFYIKP